MGSASGRCGLSGSYIIKKLPTSKKGMEALFVKGIFFMTMDLLRRFDRICDTGNVIAGYTSGLCGEWIQERFEHLAEHLNIESSMMIMANQKHTDQVRVIGIEDVGYGVNIPHDNNYADALITDQAGIMLCVHTADCVPVVLLDPVKKVVGIAHSGWVGTAKRITGKTVKKMIEEYKCRPEDIICGIGPYNHSCCYEVGEDVLECFRESFSDIECEILFCKKGNEGKYLLDLGAAVSLSLQQEGVKLENIHDEGHCTYHTSTFSSWRRTGDKKKQILTYIMLQ